MVKYKTLKILWPLYFVVVICLPVSLQNGVVHYTESPWNGGYEIETVAFFTCNPGYYKLGPNSATCTALNWYPPDNISCVQGKMFPAGISNILS